MEQLMWTCILWPEHDRGRGGLRGVFHCFPSSSSPCYPRYAVPHCEMSLHPVCCLEMTPGLSTPPLNFIYGGIEPRVVLEPEKRVLASRQGTSALPNKEKVLPNQKTWQEHMGVWCAHARKQPPPAKPSVG